MLRRMLIGLTLLLMTGVTSAYAFEQTIQLDANESPPYWSKTMPKGGLCGEILQVMSEATGLVHHINFKPLSRMIEDDSNNDLGNPEFYMDNQEFAAIIPICIYQTSFFYYTPNLKEKINIKRMDDLKGYRIGILKGTLVNRSYFEQAGIVFEESYSRESLFKKMKLGRIDLCLVIDLVGYQIINQLYPEQSNDFGSILIRRSTSPLAILLDKDYPMAQEIGNKYRIALKQIIHNGKYQEILEKYYGVDQLPDNWRQQLSRFERLYHSNASGIYE